MKQPSDYPVTSIDDLLNRTFVGSTYLIDKLLPREGLVLVSGQAKRSYKTWLTLLAAMQLATGKTIGEWKPEEPGRVLFFESEGTRRGLVDRICKIARGHFDCQIYTNVTGRGRYEQTSFNWDLDDEPTKRVRDLLTENFSIGHRVPILIDQSDWLNYLISQVETHKPDIVVLDPLSQMHGLDENSSKDVEIIMRSIKMLKEMGVSPVYVWHTNKAGRMGGKELDPDDSLRGSSALAGAYDMHWAFRQDAKTEQRYLFVSNREDETDTFEYQWDIDRDLNGAAKLKVNRPRPEDERELEEFMARIKGLATEGRAYKETEIRAFLALPARKSRQVIETLVSRGMLLQNENNHLTLRKN